MNTARIICGDVRDVLPTLAAGSVRCVVTSPPYWGLRDYGHKKQLGAERSYPEYVASMVTVFREVRRALADDGTLWLNLGDCYATGAGAVGECPGGGEQGARWAGSVSPTRGAGRPALNGRGEPHAPRYGHEGKHRYADGTAVGPMTQANRMPQPGLKPKDLVGIPWRVAFALQDDGWWLRSDCIWHKPNPMPESVTDRPTKAHEYLFLFAKSQRYFFDAEAISEPAIVGDHPRNETPTLPSMVPGASSHKGIRRSGNKARVLGPDRGRPDSHLGSGIHWEGETRNKRSVWTINTQPFPGAHFAVMPEALVEPCILAGSEGGGLVLDPFAGSGTVGVVALKHGRNFLGIELNPTYAQMARDRIHDDAPLLNRSEVG